MNAPANEKKRHHYNPVTYLKGFVDTSGCVFAWRKDQPEAPLHTVPEAIGFEKFYYSQPLPGGGRDNNSLEDFFSTIEAPWPQLLEKLATGAETDADFLPLIEFLMLTASARSLHARRHRTQSRGNCEDRGAGVGRSRIVAAEASGTSQHSGQPG